MPIKTPFQKLMAGTIFICALALGLFLNFTNKKTNTTRSMATIDESGYSKFVHFQNLRLSEFTPQRTFYLANTNAHADLIISNELDQQDLILNLSCNQHFQVAPDSLNVNIQQRNFSNQEVNHLEFQIKNRKSFSILFNSRITSCLLKYSNPSNKIQSSLVYLKAETTDFPWLAKLNSYQDTCNYETNEDADGVDKYFYGLMMPQLSCVHTINSFETLETPESGFIAKTEMLLGKKLDASFIENQNPYAEIDFSKAPKLNAIFLATLVYRADFYGTVMARLLKYHADRGALVYIVTTGYMLLEKDKKLLYPLAAKNGNFRLQEFKYYDTGNKFTQPLRFIDNKYRDMHIKLLITLSDEEQRNSVVFGGRNIHDGFLFKSKPNYNKYPSLVHYGPGEDDDFVHWNDFEMKVSSKEIALTTASHLLKFLNRDTRTQTMLNFQAKKNEFEKMPNINDSFKHFISLPYKDNYALEKLYISLIDSASKKILISSPYLRPTEKIMKALERAIARHVDVTIQTRIELIGDTQAWLYEEVNKESINKLFQKVKLYQWKENSILHSKFILVDGKVGFIGSVNLSRRSFIQDVENGYLIRSQPIIYKMEQIFETYLTKSQQITEAEKRKFLPSLLIQILKNQF